MIEIALQIAIIAFQISVIVFMVAIVWTSTVMIEEKKERQRRGLTDYYDNPIVKKENNEQSKL